MAFIGVLMLSNFLLISIAGVMVSGYYTQLRRDELNHVALAAKELLENTYRNFMWEHPNSNFWVDGKEELSDELSIVTNEFSNFVVVSDREGNVIGVDDSFPESSSYKIADEYLTKHSEDGKTSGVGTLGIFEKRHYYDAVDVYTRNGEYFATVYACLPTLFISKQINTIIRSIIYIAVGVTGIAVIASYLIAKRITNPLAKMSTAARAFAEGDFSARVMITGRDEISEFAQVFNEMAESLENTEKTRNDFVANVSHDLRSPMTSINGFIDGMLSGVIPPEQHAHYLRIVLNETKRLSRLVTTLLDISRIQAGERKFKMVNFDICEMMRQILFSFENRIDEKNLDIQFDLESDRMYVSADMDAIYQVLYNLSDNAVKFSKDNGRLVLTAKEENNKITVSVFNEGEGIPTEDVKFVFDRFYKADKSRGIDKSGTGLGLYISKKIIEAHKERIFVEGEYQSYCRFSFTLQKGEPVARRYHKPIGS